MTTRHSQGGGRTVAVLEALVDGSRNPLAYLDRDLRFVRVNRAYADRGGRAPEDYPGRSYFDLDPGAEDEAVLRRARDTGQPEVLRERPFARAGDPAQGVTWWDWKLTPVPVAGGDGEVDGLVLSLADVTEAVVARRRAEQSEQLLRLAQSAGHVGVWELDLETGRLDLTPELEALYGLVPDTVRSQADWARLVHPSDLARVTAEREAAVAGHRPFILQFRVRGPSGKERWIESRGGATYDEHGRPRLMRGVSVDVTERKRAEEALTLYRDMVNFSDDAIFVWSLGGPIVTWNAGARDLYGFSAEEAVGVRSHDLLRSVGPEPWPAVEARVRERGSWEGELRQIARDGRELVVLARLKLLRGGDGQALVLESNRDITDRKAAEEDLRRSELLFRQLFDLSPVGAVIVGLDYRFLRCNEAFCRFLGLEERELLGRTFLDVTYPDDRLAGIAETEAVRSGRVDTAHVEKRYAHSSGRAVWGDLSIRLLRDAAGRPVHFVSVIQDITARKQAEEGLREADRRKDEFLAILSHELRNPLAPIRTSLYVLERAAPGAEQARKAEAVIGRQVDHLTRLVDDLLDATRIARGKVLLQRERLDLGDLVRRTVEDHRPIFAANGVDLEASMTTQPLWVEGDAIRLAQVVGNLLSNAVKFTPAGGRVEVSLTAEAGAATLRVHDTGIGIAPDDLGRVFETFTQVGQTLDRTRGGLGLGLALVKGLVELHGGFVDAASEGPGRGATFTVRLPVEAQPAAGIETAPAAAPAARRRVLVIEDNPDAADSLREALELDGHEVEVAHDGGDGIEKARSFRPDVVLCDIGLPGLDGYAVARALRADANLRGVLLVALTGYALPEDIARAMEAGFDRHLAKPPDVEQLERALAAVDDAAPPAAPG